MSYEKAGRKLGLFVLGGDEDRHTRRAKVQYMRRIIADLPKDLPGESTASAAIRSAIKFDEDRQKDELSLVLGKQVERIEFGDDIVEMDCGRYAMRIHLRDDGVAYEVVSKPAALRFSPNEIVEMQLGRRQFEWDRRGIFDRLVGQTLHRVFVSQMGLFLYASNVDILLVSVLQDVEKRRLFLYWDFTD